MIVAINYADLKFRNAQKFNEITAIHKGKADKVISYFPKDIDDSFKRKNKNILEQKRGNGYWLWKPYFIKRTLERMNEGDYLVYLDSGAFYINDVRHLTRQMEKDDQNIMAFELPFKERRYTKRDVFVVMECDTETYTDTNQRMATMIIFRKDRKSAQFVNEWLYYCQYEDILTDAPNHMGRDNYKEFIDHRHDQSIFSVLSKKYEIKAYGDPSQFGRLPKMFWGDEIDRLAVVPVYPQIIAEHREYALNKSIFWEQMIYAHAPVRIAELYHEGIFGKIQTKKKIAVLTDNMPIRENIYGFGMYKVVNRLLKALGSNVDTIIVTDRNYNDGKTDPVLRGKITAVNKFHKMDDLGFSDIWFFIEIGRTICRLRRRGIQNIFIPLGANYKELRRAYLVSKIYHMRVSIYVVDDFIEHYYRISGSTERLQFEKKIVRYLRGVNRIFVISKGMKNRMECLTGKKTILLPLPYEYKEEITEDWTGQNQIMFVGSINRLYIQGIKDTAEIIDKINQERGANIRLLFTYRNATEVKRLIGNYKCICSRRIEQEGELRKEIKNSMFCIMPYSDEEELSLLQKTSFPSKLIEYMSSARFIVIYGSDKNSAQQYFEENHLPQVIYGRDKGMLEKCIVRLLDEKADYSRRYLAVLEQSHSPKCIREKLMRYL